jgi:hypothetical protein
MLVAISALAASNLAYLAVHLRSDRVWLSRFRAVAASLPEGARVLPVYTLSRSGVGRPYFHDAALAVVVDHNGFIPYMFSGDQGQPQRYFRYLKRPYAPPIDWYSESFSDTVHWGAIACAYDFMLITKPYEPRRIGAWTRVSAENSAAALLVIDKRQCTGDSAPAQNSGTVP